MPNKSFTCARCGHKFEVRVKIGGVYCPVCRHRTSYIKPTQKRERVAPKRPKCFCGKQFRSQYMLQRHFDNDDCLAVAENVADVQEMENIDVDGVERMAENVDAEPGENLDHGFREDAIVHLNAPLIRNDGGCCTIL